MIVLLPTQSVPSLFVTAKPKTGSSIRFPARQSSSTTSGSPLAIRSSGLPPASVNRTAEMTASFVPHSRTTTAPAFWKPRLLYWSTTCPGSPTRTILPASRRRTESLTSVMVSRSCETMSIVFPARLNCAIFSRHFFLNVSSPTAITSSMRRMSGFTSTATAKPRRTYIPEE